MNFPQYGKSLAAFSAQWKNFGHGMEPRAEARTHNNNLKVGS